MIDIWASLGLVFATFSIFYPILNLMGNHCLFVIFHIQSLGLKKWFNMHLGVVCVLYHEWSPGGGTRPKSTIRLSQYKWVSPYSTAALPDDFRIHFFIYNFWFMISPKKPFKAAKQVKLLSTIRFHLVIRENVPFFTISLCRFSLSPLSLLVEPGHRSSPLSPWKRSELHVWSCNHCRILFQQLREWCYAMSVSSSSAYKMLAVSIKRVFVNHSSFSCFTLMQHESFSLSVLRTDLWKQECYTKGRSTGGNLNSLKACPKKTLGAVP